MEALAVHGADVVMVSEPIEQRTDETPRDAYGGPLLEQ
jgi:hypothetical protein